MAQYTLTLKSEEDFHMIKKLLKAFEGASIKPIPQPKSHIEKALEEAKKAGSLVPFTQQMNL